jgi:hypothetical protein
MEYLISASIVNAGLYVFFMKTLIIEETAKKQNIKKATAASRKIHMRLF